MLKKIVSDNLSVKANPKPSYSPWLEFVGHNILFAIHPSYNRRPSQDGMPSIVG